MLGNGCRRWLRRVKWIAGAGAIPNQNREADGEVFITSQEARRMVSLTGKTIRWRFVDDPAVGTTYEHSFDEDGSVTWRIVEGPHKGSSRREKSVAAVKVNERT